MRWGRREWGLEGHPWPPLEWTNINSIERHGQETETEKEKCQTDATWYSTYSSAGLCTYIVAFSQEVKCKSICFCCCRNMRDKSVREFRKSNYQLYVRFKLSHIIQKTQGSTWKEKKCDKETGVQLKSNNNLLTMSHITRRALWPRALTAIQFIPFPVHPPSPISHWYMGHVGIQCAAREAGKH